MAAGPRLGATEEQLYRVVERTEQISERLADLAFFRKLRQMGSRSRTILVLLVASAVILYWRGLWSFYDLVFEYVLPEHRVTGAFLSVLLGALLLVGTGKLIDALGGPGMEEKTRGRRRAR